MGTHVRERETHIREFVMVERQALRQRMEAAIESLLALLDELEGDADLESANDDEPSLGWEGGQPSRHFFVAPWDDSIRRYDDTDLEQDAGDEPEGRDTDREYTAPERAGAGFVYAGHDDAEDSHDAEWDQAEDGIADMDGLIEQDHTTWSGVAI